MLSALRAAIWRDILLAMRRPSDVYVAVAFFIITVSLFPLGIGPDAALLRAIAPGVIWVAALLASMLALPRMFAADHVDGTLEQMLVGAAPLGGLVLAKVCAHWLVSGLPLVVVSPLLALQYDLPRDSLALLTFGLLLGTPVMSFIGAIGAALTLGLRASGVLLALLVLPLYVPVLILGTGVVDRASAGLSVAANFLLIGALLVVAAVFSPWAAAAALRVSSE